MTEPSQWFIGIGLVAAIILVLMILRPSLWNMVIKGCNAEKFSHYPPSRDENKGATCYPPNGPCPYTSTVEGAEHRKLETAVREAAIPKSGIDIFGARYETIYKDQPGVPMTMVKEGFVNHNLNVDDSVPRRVVDVREGPPQKYHYRDPMAKDCMARNPDAFPLWPLSYEYPYRDPLFQVTTTGLYTAQNDDPEDLKEQRLWPHAI